GWPRPRWRRGVQRGGSPRPGLDGRAGDKQWLRRPPPNADGDRVDIRPADPGGGYRQLHTRRIHGGDRVALQGCYPCRQHQHRVRYRALPEYRLLRPVHPYRRDELLPHGRALEREWGRPGRDDIAQREPELRLTGRVP